MIVIVYNQVDYKGVETASPPVQCLKSSVTQQQLDYESLCGKWY